MPGKWAKVDTWALVVHHQLHLHQWCQVPHQQLEESQNHFRTTIANKQKILQWTNHKAAKKSLDFSKNSQPLFCPEVWPVKSIYQTTKINRLVTNSCCTNSCCGTSSCLIDDSIAALFNDPFSNIVFALLSRFFCTLGAISISSAISCAIPSCNSRLIRKNGLLQIKMEILFNMSKPNSLELLYLGLFRPRWTIVNHFRNCGILRNIFIPIFGLEKYIFGSWCELGCTRIFWCMHFVMWWSHVVTQFD